MQSRPPTRRRPRLRIRKPPPPRTTLAAALFLIGGIVLTILGAAIGILEDANRGLVLIGLGILRECSCWLAAVNVRGRLQTDSYLFYIHARPPFVVIIPGSFASWTLYGAYHRWPGYSYDQVPSYDD